MSSLLQPLEGCIQQLWCRAAAYGLPVLILSAVLCLSAGAKAKGLPAGVRLEDLQMVKVEATPSTLPDYNPDMDCQFFHTRQVGTWMLVQSQDVLGIKAVPLFSEGTSTLFASCAAQSPSVLLR